jgi:multimeric flavodoxin WrbA
MNVLLINGSPHKDGCTFTALSEIAGEPERQGIETRIFPLNMYLFIKKGTNCCFIVQNQLYLLLI